LRRPDGTLPIYGDTGSGVSDPLAAAPDATGRIATLRRARDWRPDRSFSLFPIAGHALWWRGLEKWPDVGDLTQTVVTWANFPGHGHKLADEMSIVLWSGGQSWVTNTGYWPYGVWGREHAVGWEGANAPHLSGESRNSARTAELLGYGDNGRVTVLDLRRQGPAGYAARRQLVQLGSELWLVLDQIQDKTPRRSITLWTVDPTLAVVQEPSENAYRLKSRGNGAIMSAHFLASEGTEIKTFSGSRLPFAGWVVTGQPTPATAIRIEQPSKNSWALALWLPEKGGDAGAVSAPPQMLEWISSDRWKLSIPLRRGDVVLQRIDSEVLVRESAGAQDIVRVTLAGTPDISAERAVIKSAFEAVEIQFKKRYRDLYRYRLKVTLLLLAIFAIQEVAVCFLLRNVMRKHLFALRMALSSAWLIMGAWVVFVYLES